MAPIQYLIGSRHFIWHLKDVHVRVRQICLGREFHSYYCGKAPLSLAFKPGLDPSLHALAMV